MGCDPANASATVPAVCDNVAGPAVPEQFNSNGSNAYILIDAFSSRTSCDANPTPDELDYWGRNSIVSDGVRYGILTPVSSYDCIDVQGGTVNVVPGMNSYLFQKLRAVDRSGSRFRSTCVVNGVNGTCSGESVLTDARTAAIARAEMELRCRR